MSSLALYDAIKAAMATTRIAVLDAPNVLPSPPFAWVTYGGHAFARGNQPMATINVVLFSDFESTGDADRKAIQRVEDVLPALRDVRHCLIVGVESETLTEANVTYLTARIDIEEKR